MTLAGLLRVLLQLILGAGFALLLLAVALIVRRRLLVRSGGTFECGMRERRYPGGRGWMLGIARYTNDGLDWFRILSLAPRPRASISRRRFEVVGRRPPARSERHVVPSGAVVLDCRNNGKRLELAMSTPALTGLLAWLESAPPGQQADVA